MSEQQPQTKSVNLRDLISCARKWVTIKKNPHLRFMYNAATPANARGNITALFGSLDEVLLQTNSKIERLYQIAQTKGYNDIIQELDKPAGDLNLSYMEY